MKIIGSILFIALTLVLSATMFIITFTLKSNPDYTLGTNLMHFVFVLSLAIFNLVIAIVDIITLFKKRSKSKRERNYFCIGCGKKNNLKKRNYAGVRNGQQYFTCLTCVDKKMKAHSKSVHAAETKKIERINKCDRCSREIPAGTIFYGNEKDETKKMLCRKCYYGDEHYGELFGAEVIKIKTGKHDNDILWIPLKNAYKELCNDYPDAYVNELQMESDLDLITTWNPEDEQFYIQVEQFKQRLIAKFRRKVAETKETETERIEDTS